MIVREICCMRNSPPKKIPRMEGQLLSETMNQDGVL